VRERAGGRCEQCFKPDTEPVYPHEPDHSVALKHGGPTASENLAYAYFECNRAKRSDIALLDPATGALTPLYHPRTQRRGDHFRFVGALIEPLSALGRATTSLLRRLNQDIRVAIRESLLRAGRNPLPDESR